MRWSDTYAKTQHPAEISRHIDENAYAILIMDQAGWHMSNILVAPGNISILPLPPKSLDLTRLKTAGSSCAITGSQTGSSIHTETSLTIAATPGGTRKLAVARHVHRCHRNGHMSSDD